TQEGVPVLHSLARQGAAPGDGQRRCGVRNLASRIGIAVLLGLAASRAEAASLRDRLAGASQTVGLASGSAFYALADVIADTAARPIPVVSPSCGFASRFNPHLAVFARTSATCGPIFP